MFVGDKTRLGERRVWINLSVGNTAQATVQFHPIFMQGTWTLLAFLLILPIMIERQVGPPHELKKRSLSTPFLYWGSEIYTHTHVSKHFAPFQSAMITSYRCNDKRRLWQSHGPLLLLRAGRTRGEEKPRSLFLASLFFLCHIIKGSMNLQLNFPGCCHHFDW